MLEKVSNTVRMDHHPVPRSEEGASTMVEQPLQFKTEKWNVGTLKNRNQSESMDLFIRFSSVLSMNGWNSSNTEVPTIVRHPQQGISIVKRREASKHRHTT